MGIFGLLRVTKAQAPKEKARERAFPEGRGTASSPRRQRRGYYRCAARGRKRPWPGDVARPVDVGQRDGATAGLGERSIAGQRDRAAAGLVLCQAKGYRTITPASTPGLLPLRGEGP
jgi:hypothetical protein